ncbi:MAG TPA: methionyl-tRNA formyltransferase [Chitinophagaceae bacterium]|nr:methionyl-tRNA formyltransferase [Chitinophagaceae bacterium]
MIQYQLKSKKTEPTTFNLALSVHRIVFMGTPEFAVPGLDAILRAGFNIVGVITAPDKPSGRGMKVHESAIKKYALEKGLKILQPEKLKAPEFLEELRSLNADMQVVVAFRMLPEIVWNMPPKGTINLHASLLPQYRGAAPINWVIINGEKETGATTFKLQHEIDTGNILLQEKIPISEDETAGELHDRMMEVGAHLLVKTLEGVFDGSLQETSQASAHGQDSALKHAPKIHTETCRIDWNKSVDEIYNLIRGLSPYPAAFTELGDKMMKVFKSKKEINIPGPGAGKWETDRRTYLKFACRDGYIHLTEIQLEGKKRMNIEEFLRGFRFE